MHTRQVLGTSRGDYTAAAAGLGAAFTQDMDDFCESHPDVVILATSITSTEAVLRGMPLQRLRRSTLFVDVLSVKEFPRRLLLSLLPPQVTSRRCIWGCLRGCKTHLVPRSSTFERSAGVVLSAPLKLQQMFTVKAVDCEIIYMRPLANFCNRRKRQYAYSWTSNFTPVLCKRPKPSRPDGGENIRPVRPAVRHPVHTSHVRSRQRARQLEGPEVHVREGAGRQQRAQPAPRQLPSGRAQPPPPSPLPLVYSHV